MIISLAAIGLLCASGIGDAQQPVSPLYRIGFLSPTSHGPNIEAFQQGLKELGYIEGRNVVLETRFAEGRLERLPELAANLLSLKVDVIVTGSEPGVRAAKNATTTVPIVFAGITDPLGTGLVGSLAHPGGNITGVTFGVAGASLGGKWVELLKEAVPSIARVAALSNASDPQTPPLLRQMENAARALNVELEVFDVRSTGELDKALATIAKSSAQGLIVSNSPVFSGNRAKLSEFAASKRLPAIYFYNLFMASRFHNRFFSARTRSSNEP